MDYDTKIVYATIQATNSFDGYINTDYAFGEENGSYYCYDLSGELDLSGYTTNVDLAELNEKLQDYISTAGR